MAAAVHLPIARTPFHNTHGAFFLNFNFHHVGGEVKASETKGPKQQWFSPPRMVFGGGGGGESREKKGPMGGCCRRVPWLLVQEQQLPWLLCGF
jgi:hypothetical protein